MRKNLSNFWYSARPTELFLDLDSRRALRRAVTVLTVAISRRKLPVGKVYLYPTRRDGHFHAIVVLRREIPFEEKVAWQLWMGGDRLRAAYVLARRVDSRAPGHIDILVSSRAYYRAADTFCRCRGKHKADAVVSRCPAMRELLGNARLGDYFARTGQRRVKPLVARIPYGEISIEMLRRWSRI